MKDKLTRIKQRVTGTVKDNAVPIAFGGGVLIGGGLVMRFPNFFLEVKPGPYPMPDIAFTETQLKSIIAGSLMLIEFINDKGLAQEARESLATQVEVIQKTLDAK